MTGFAVMAYRVNIAEAGNTRYGHPLRLLRWRGFSVFYPPSENASSHEGMDLWALNPNGTRLIASSPLALLGLLFLVDNLGDDWYTDPRIDFSDAPQGEQPDTARPTTPEELVKASQRFLEAAEEERRRIEEEE